MVTTATMVRIASASQMYKLEMKRVSGSSADASFKRNWMRFEFSLNRNAWL